MHSVTLNTVSGILLLSSIVSLGLLLKRTPKARFTTSTSVFTMSDILSCFLTALIVFLYQFYPNNGIGNTLLNKSNNSRYVSEKMTGDENCDLKDVLLQYAMFIVPFASAFVSLLSFSTNLYASATQIGHRCCKLMNAEKQETRLADPDVEVYPEGSKIKNKGIILKKIKPFGFPSKKYTAFAVLSQWIVSALFGGSFQLGQLEKVALGNRSTGDLICSLTANFPFENFMNDLRLDTSESFNSDSLAISSSIKNYISSEDNLLWSHPNSSQVQNVLDKIYNIVKSQLNDSEMVSEMEQNRTYYNISQLRNAVKREKIPSIEAPVDGWIAVENYHEIIESQTREAEMNLLSKDLNFADRKNVSFEKMQFNQCMRNQCVLSANFLKIYCFLFLILIYFLPIFLSTLLLVISHYKCREITNKLNKPELKQIIEDGNVEVDKDTFEKAQQSKMTESSNIQESQSGKDAMKFQDMMCDLLRETQKMQKIFHLYRTNALAAVILWSPLLLQLILRVFFCSSISEWFTETTFVAAMAFATLKNAVNLNVMKIEADSENLKKRNSVHPD